MRLAKSPRRFYKDDVDLGKSAVTTSVPTEEVIDHKVPAGHRPEDVVELGPPRAWTEERHLQRHSFSLAKDLLCAGEDFKLSALNISLDDEWTTKAVCLAQAIEGNHRNLT